MIFQEIKLHNIVISLTSHIDYEMTRWILLEDLEDLEYKEYVVVEGYHCSCYDFNDTKWEAIKYTKDELLRLAKEKLKRNFWYGEEKQFYDSILDYFNAGR